MIREAILAFARSLDFEESHSLQDERLALLLFDEMARLGLHTLATTDGGPQTPAEPPILSPREILSCAAILHDIGYVEGYEAHHKTAFRLIMAAALPGLSSRDRALIAHVARYHRSSTPDPAQHTAFAALPAADRALVEQLGAILRFADGLDRTHTNAVQDLRCDLDGDRFLVTLLPGVHDETERGAGQKKARWFEKVLGVQMTLL